MADLIIWNSTLHNNIQHEIRKCQDMLKMTLDAPARKALFKQISDLQRKEEVLGGNDPKPTSYYLVTIILNGSTRRQGPLITLPC